MRGSNIKQLTYLIIKQLNLTCFYCYHNNKKYLRRNNVTT